MVLNFKKPFLNLSVQEPESYFFKICPICALHQNGSSILSWNFLTAFSYSNGKKGGGERQRGKSSSVLPPPINYLWGWSKGGPVQPVHIRTCAQGRGSASPRRASWGEAHTRLGGSLALVLGSGQGVTVIRGPWVAGRKARISCGCLS